MNKVRSIARVSTQETAENRTKVIAATAELARDGHVLEPAGLKTANFLRSSSILFNHDSDHPVAAPVSCTLAGGGDRLEVEIEWPPAGISAKSDEIRGLVKAGVIRAVSVGFMPLESEPLDPKNPWAGQKFIEADLLELSFVGVPADTGAVVTQRSDKGDDWKCGASRTLPIEDSDAWDGSAAEASIFSWAGGDDFDPGNARKGFLAYNAAKPKERGSYKLPIAHVVDGRMKVPKGAIRAAASRLPQADIPANVQAEARAVLDHYEEKADMGKPKRDEGRAAPVQTRRLTKKVEGELDTAIKHHERAATHHKSLDGHLDGMDGHMEAAMDAHEKARAAHEDLGEALESARSEPAKAAEHIERAIKLHAAVERHHRAVRTSHDALDGAHEDAEGAHESLGRCMREAHEAVKRAKGADGESHIPGDEDDAGGTDGDSDLVQTSGGTDTSGGSSNGRSMDALRRRVRLLKLV